jgi:hypothetical protein
MRITHLFGLVLVVAFAGCHSSSKPSSQDAPVVKKVAPGADFGPYPMEYILRTVETFQAKWPADVVYHYRFELPRRVQNNHTKRFGYAVRFRAQKVTQTAPMPDGLPWVAYFENGKLSWVQRDTEVTSILKWIDPAQSVVDWPPAPTAPAQ